MKIWSKIYLLSFLVFLLAMPQVASAATPLLPACATGAGDCHSCDFIKMMVSWAQFALQLIGSFALGAFVFGGFMWLISAGNPERVQKGRQVMVEAVIGIALALGSFLIVNFMIAAFTGQPLNDVQFFGQDLGSFEC